jgi:dUTP pyrophosphatase
MVYNSTNEDINISIGDRIGQIIIIPYPEIEFVEVDELSDSERGTGGYGSSGK